MTTSITLRNTKGSPLTYNEVDANFTNLAATADAATISVSSKAEAVALGVAADAADMGTFNGSTIPDNSDAKEAIQALETTVETKANASALGIAATAADMGTFTGSTIPDAQTGKQAIQALETAVELRTTIASLADNAGSDSGDSLVGSDDGSSGSLWTTIKGFISYLKSSVGSSIVGFIQSGTGAVARTVQDKLRDIKTSADTGGTVKTVVEYRNGPSMTGDNVLVWPGVNRIAADLNACIISGGGSNLNENLIGYQEYIDEITGNGSTTVFTSTFDIDDVSEVRVSLIRADNVRLGVTYLSSILIEKVGTKARVTYPIPGHFVNDGPAGAEGTNAAVLSTQQLIIYSVVKDELTGTNADLSGVHGGYDNIIERGIMTHVMGAHHRVYDGSHNTVWGGSYGTIYGGEYGGIWGGTNNKINVSLTSGSVIVGGGANKITGSGPATIVGGTGQSVSGVAATAIGGQSNTVSGNGASATGRGNTASGQDSFAAGSTNTASGSYSVTTGLQNTVSGAYSFGVGRQNTAAGAYSVATGRSNSASGDYSRAFGYRATADFIGETATGFGKDADSANDLRKLREVGFSVDTTDGTAGIYMTNSAGGNALTIPADGAAMIRVDAIALRDDNTQSQAFTGNFLVTRSGTGDPLVNGAATDQALTSVNALGAAAWTCSVRGISGSLRMRVTGETGKNIRWLAVMRLVQVIY